MTSKTVDQFAAELWTVVRDSAKDLLEEVDVKAVARDLVEYAARAQFAIHATADPAIRELAEREFTHRAAHIEGELAGIALVATKKSRLVGILEGLFQVLLKYGPLLLA